MTNPVRPRAVKRTGAFSAISALLAISMLCSCGLQMVEGYRRAFDPPDRKVIIVLAAERSVSVWGATSATEGAGLGAVRAVGAAASIIFIPFIPFLLYAETKEGADMKTFLDANPDWKDKLENWMAKRNLEESFRSEIQSLFPLEPNAHPTRFPSTEAAVARFANDRPRNLTVVAITKVSLTMQKDGCPACVSFWFWADMQLIDGESGEVLLYDTRGARQASKALPLSDYLIDDFAKLDAAMTSAMKSAATVVVNNFKGRCGRNVPNCGG